MRIDRLIWDGRNRAHVARHNVTVEEVEDVCAGRHYARHVRGARYSLLGQTEQGRYLSVVVDKVAGYTYRPVTAREMNR